MVTNSPITFSHWHTEPALIGGILFVCWAYFVLMGLIHSRDYPSSSFRTGHMLFGSGPV